MILDIVCIMFVWFLGPYVIYRFPEYRTNFFEFMRVTFYVVAVHVSGSFVISRLVVTSFSRQWPNPMVVAMGGVAMTSMSLIPLFWRTVVRAIELLVAVYLVGVDWQIGVLDADWGREVRCHYFTGEIYLSAIGVCAFYVSLFKYILMFLLKSAYSCGGDVLVEMADDLLPAWAVRYLVETYVWMVKPILSLAFWQEFWTMCVDWTKSMNPSILTLISLDPDFLYFLGQELMDILVEYWDRLLAWLGGILPPILSVIPFDPANAKQAFEDIVSEYLVIVINLFVMYTPELVSQVDPVPVTAMVVYNSPSFAQLVCPTEIYAMCLFQFFEPSGYMPYTMLGKVISLGASLLSIFGLIFYFPRQ